MLTIAAAPDTFISAHLPTMDVCDHPGVSCFPRPGSMLDLYMGLVGGTKEIS
jgi:hypothetical protein